MYAAILLFGVTLTLPGFAGLILTIGVAADANVVIFERIKEKSRAGKSVRAAISDGLREGLPHDPRRERRHGDHRADPVRGRDRRREGLRADAADRHRRLADHRRRGDARDARSARRLPLVREPEFHGRRPFAARLGSCRSTSWAASSCGSRSRGVVLLIGARLARRARPEPRHRLQGRRADRVHDGRTRRRSPMCAARCSDRPAATPSSRAAARVERRRRLQELPDPAEEARPGGADDVTNSLKDKRQGGQASARRTCRRASAGRSRSRRSSRSSSRCS